MTRLVGLLLVLGAACGPPGGKPVPPPPPQVFLTVGEANVIGDSVKGKVAVSGCKTIAQVQLLEGDSFLLDLHFSQSPTDFSLPANVFASKYSKLGIAAPLTLKAKVVCDDGRSNESLPVGVRFFPIASRFGASGGEQLVPDNFMVEGGLGGSPTTFLGCIATTTGTTIARVNTRGEVVASIQAMPFDCTLSTQVSEMSSTTGTRWILEPSQGAYAINQALQVQKVLRSNKASRMGVGPKGSVVVWIAESGRQKVVKMDPVPSQTNDWSFPPPLKPGLSGIMNSDPVVDDGAGGAVWVSDWRFDMGTRRADIFPFKLDLRTGAHLNNVGNDLPAVILSQQYPVSEVSEPIMPEGVFSSDGMFFTLPLLSGMTTLNTTVISCSTAAGLCENTARRWTSPTFPGMFRMVIPFSQGNIYSVIGPFGVYFLDAKLGSVMNLGMKPLQPSGSLMVVSVQPGLGTEFYVLAGPDLGAGVTSFPAEIIATDAPGSGELWRLQFGSGESSIAGMHIGIDDGAQAWIRAGTDLIKPLPNWEYRAARGVTSVP